MKSTKVSESFDKEMESLHNESLRLEKSLINYINKP